MIYVDDLKQYDTKLKNKIWCHLWADDVSELHEFAQKIGLKREWFQNKRLFAHYDLVPSKRILALENGAIYINLKEYLKNKNATVAQW